MIEPIDRISIEETTMRRRSLLSQISLAVFSACLSLAANSRAADVVWNLPNAQGSWETGVNWLPNRIPTTTDTAVIEKSVLSRYKTERH